MIRVPSALRMVSWEPGLVISVCNLSSTPLHGVRTRFNGLSVTRSIAITATIETIETTNWL